MAASSGFWWSPGHAALGDELRIALAHRHGHIFSRHCRLFQLLLS
jgi:hypothetical protein